MKGQPDRPGTVYTTSKGAGDDEAAVQWHPNACNDQVRRAPGNACASRRPGREDLLTKPLANQRDLSLAYSPGVAEPCLEIERDPDLAYTYTAKGNLVAVVTNGTAVLGLDIGAIAGKPVMEEEIFKQFADIDVFDLEVGSENPDDVIKFCQLLEPTVGGIHLEDIRAPDCFYIEETLRKTLKIPVFHDDQHGTAIISGAALLNAIEIVAKNIAEIKVVFSGAGAAAISTAEHYIRLGVKRENILMCDRAGVIYVGRPGEIDQYKARFEVETDARSLADALVDADVFVGLSVAGAVTGDMIAAMAPRPIIFALANPVPEIASGRSACRAFRCDHRHGAQRLSESGQQRPRLPVHFPRCTRRTRHGDQ